MIPENKIAKLRVHSDLIRSALHLPDDTQIVCVRPHDHDGKSIVVEFTIRSETLNEVAEADPIPVVAAWIKMNPSEDGKLNPGFWKWSY